MNFFRYFITLCTFTTAIQGSDSYQQLTLTSRNLARPVKLQDLKTELKVIIVSLQSMIAGHQKMITDPNFSLRAGNHTCEVQASMLLHLAQPSYLQEQLVELRQLLTKTSRLLTAIEKFSSQDTTVFGQSHKNETLQQYFINENVMTKEPISDYLKVVGLCYFLAPESDVVLPTSTIKSAAQKELIHLSNTFIHQLARNHNISPSATLLNHPFTRVFLIIKQALASSQPIALKKHPFCSCGGKQPSSIEFFAPDTNATTYIPSDTPHQNVLLFEGLQYEGSLLSLQETLSVDTTERNYGIPQKYYRSCSCSSKKTNTQQITDSLFEQIVSNAAALSTQPEEIKLVDRYQHYTSLAETGYSPQNMKKFCITRCLVRNPYKLLEEK